MLQYGRRVHVICKLSSLVLLTALHMRWTQLISISDHSVYSVNLAGLWLVVFFPRLAALFCTVVVVGHRDFLVQLL